MFSGLDRFEARKKLWSELEETGLAVKKEAYTMRVPRSQRGGEVHKCSTPFCLKIHILSSFFLTKIYLLSDNRAPSKQAVVCDNGALGGEGSPSSGKGRLDYHARKI